MAALIRLISIGDALGIILPDELLTGMGKQVGDIVYLVEDGEGRYFLEAAKTSDQPRCGEVCE